MIDPTVRIDQLEARLAEVERRLEAIDHRASHDTAGAARGDESRANATLMSRAATQIGRILLIFGGAYFLRAITGLDFVPAAVGLSLGAAYALVWLWMADRSAHRSERTADAVFYAFATCALGFPLLVEAGVRFELLDGTQGILALTVFCALGLIVAARSCLLSLAWLVTSAGAITAVILSRSLHVSEPVGVFLVLLGLGSLWAGYVHNRWWGPQWLGALAANVGVFIVAMHSRSDAWSVSPLAAPALGWLMVVAYTASAAIRSHMMGRSIGPFEIAQALLGFAVTMTVTLAAIRSGALPGPLAGGGVLAFGLLVYMLAVTPGTRAARGPDYHFYAIFGLIGFVVGCALLLPGAQAGAVLAFMALIMAIVSGRTGRVSFSLQCTLLLTIAGVMSGFLALGTGTLVGDPLVEWPTPSLFHIVIAACCVASLFVPVAQHSERWGVLAGAPQLIVLALSVWMIGGLMVALIAPPLAGVPGPDASLPAVAALRTVVLAAAAVTLALSSHHRRWPEARWLSYPLLILLVIKLATEDFPLGQPAELFIALAAVGGALMVVSRLLRQPATA